MGLLVTEMEILRRTLPGSILKGLAVSGSAQWREVRMANDNGNEWTE